MEGLESRVKIEKSRGRGGTHVMHGRGRMAIAPSIPAMTGRSTLGVHRLGGGVEVSCFCVGIYYVQVNSEVVGEGVGRRAMGGLIFFLQRVCVPMRWAVGRQLYLAIDMQTDGHIYRRRHRRAGIPTDGRADGWTYRQDRQPIISQEGEADKAGGERYRHIDGQEDGRADGRRPKVFYVGVSAVSMSWNGWGSARDKPFSWQLFGGGGDRYFFFNDFVAMMPSSANAVRCCAVECSVPWYCRTVLYFAALHYALYSGLLG